MHYQYFFILHTPRSGETILKSKKNGDVGKYLKLLLYLHTKKTFAFCIEQNGG